MFSYSAQNLSFGTLAPFVSCEQRDEVLVAMRLNQDVCIRRITDRAGAMVIGHHSFNKYHPNANLVSPVLHEPVCQCHCIRNPQLCCRLRLLRHRPSLVLSTASRHVHVDRLGPFARTLGHRFQARPFSIGCFDYLPGRSYRRRRDSNHYDWGRPSGGFQNVTA